MANVKTDNGKILTLTAEELEEELLETIKVADNDTLCAAANLLLGGGFCYDEDGARHVMRLNMQNCKVFGKRAATPAQMLNALLESEELFIRSEVGDAIVEAVDELEGGDAARAIALLNAMLDSDALAVEAAVGDELTLIRNELEAAG